MRSTGGTDDLTISCDDCAMRRTAACDDCIVTFLCERDPEEAVVIDVEEARAIRVLEHAGLASGLRYVRRTG